MKNVCVHSENRPCIKECVSGTALLSMAADVTKMKRRGFSTRPRVVRKLLWSTVHSCTYILPHPNAAATAQHKIYVLSYYDTHYKFLLHSMRRRNAHIPVTSQLEKRSSDKNKTLFTAHRRPITVKRVKKH